MEQQRLKSQKGFSLIELSIFVMFLGVMMAGALYGYNVVVEKKRVTATNEAMDETLDAMAKYLSLNRRLPCPASTEAGPSDAAYGVETDCSDTATIATGSCAGGICVAAGAGGTRIRIGSVPFRALGIGHEDVADAYGGRLTYAVTERQASGATQYASGAGGVILNNISTGTASNTDFVLISHGANRYGGYTDDGINRDCPAGGASCSQIRMGREFENFNNDGTFVIAPVSIVDNGDRYDDIVVSSIWERVNLWGEAESDSRNSFNRNTGNMGIGTETPAEKMHVAAGNLQIDELVASAAASPYTPRGKLDTPNLCDGNGNNCFSPALIGGRFADGNGLSCPAVGDPASARFMVGISRGRPICSSIFGYRESATCPPGQYAQGYSIGADGQLAVSCNTINMPAVVIPPGPCPLPWGGNINDGLTVEAYNGVSCTPIVRRCTGGALDGNPSYNQQNEPASCSVCYEWSTPQANPGCLDLNGGSMFSIVGSFIDTDGGGNPTCNAGSNGLSEYKDGAYTGPPDDDYCGGVKRSCGICGTVTPPVTCPLPAAFGVGTRNQGQTIQAYNNTDCTSQTRTCQADGTFDNPSYTNANPPPSCTPADCTLPWGETLADGQQRTAYKGSYSWGAAENSTQFCCDALIDDMLTVCNAEGVNKYKYTAPLAFGYGNACDLGKVCSRRQCQGTCESKELRCNHGTLEAADGSFTGDGGYTQQNDCSDVAPPVDTPPNDPPQACPNGGINVLTGDIVRVGWNLSRSQNTLGTSEADTRDYLAAPGGRGFSPWEWRYAQHAGDEDAALNELGGGTWPYAVMQTNNQLSGYHVGQSNAADQMPPSGQSADSYDRFDIVFDQEGVWTWSSYTNGEVEGQGYNNQYSQTYCVTQRPCQTAFYNWSHPLTGQNRDATAQDCN